MTMPPIYFSEFVGRAPGPTTQPSSRVFCRSGLWPDNPPSLRAFAKQSSISSGQGPDLQFLSRQRLVIISDDNVAPLYAQDYLAAFKSQGFTVDVITIPAGEHSKSREMKAKIEDQLFELGCGRDTVLIALGGGVVTDLVGFVAATYCRGVPVIYYPTTLLAMVDAAIGGKTGINTPSGKNTLGTFTQPKAIILDLNTLNSLPDEHYLSAFSEIVKHALIADQAYFKSIVRDWESLKAKDHATLIPVIKRSIAIKTEVVKADAREQGKRESLNFGHTVGHAFEQASGYSLSHGTAVAIGMAVESTLSYQLGFLDEALLARIHDVIREQLGVTQAMLSVNEAAFLSALQQDKKKRQRDIRCVLLKAIGEIVTENQSYAQPVTPSSIMGALEETLRRV